MKPFFLIFFCALGLLAKAQCPKSPQWVNSYYNYWGLKDSVLFQLPRRAPLNTCRDSGMTYYNPTDSSLHWWTGFTDRTFSPGTTLPGLPQQSVQVNSGNTFRGFSDFIYDTVRKSLHYDSARWFFTNIYPDTIIRKFIQVHTIDGDTATITQGSSWYESLDQNFVNPDGLRDAVHVEGWNTDGSGGRVNNHAAAMTLNMENHFTPGGGRYDMELHIPEMIYVNGTRSRPLSLTIADSSVNGFAQWDMRFSNFNWAPPNGLRNIMTTDSSGKFTLNNIGDNNEPFILHNNATGNEFNLNASGTAVNVNTSSNFNIDLGNAGGLNITGAPGGLTVKSPADAFLSPLFIAYNSSNIANFVIHGDGSIDANDQFDLNGPVYITGPSVAIGVATVDASAALQINSTTKGLLFARMTTTQKNAITSPAEGLVVYDLTLHKLSVFTGTVWETITSL